jgi:hypothetical protein
VADLLVRKKERSTSPFYICWSISWGIRLFSEWENFTSDFSHHSCHYVFNRKKLFALKLLKNYLRSTMGTEWLNGLASMFIIRSIMLDPQEVIEEYAKKYPRRLELLYERKV